MALLQAPKEDESSDLRESDEEETEELEEDYMEEE